MPYVRELPDQPPLQHRPPADALPASFAERFAQFDELSTRLTDAENELRDLNDPAREREADKRTRAAHLEAVKSGETDTISDHVKELHQRRETLQRTTEALAAARDEIFYEIHDARSEMLHDSARLDSQIDKARATYRAHLGKLRSSTSALSELLALRAWLANHRYDPSSYIAPGELIHGLANLTGIEADEFQSIRYGHVLDRFEDFTTLTTKK